MVVIWTFLFLLALPSLCVRFTILHRSLPLHFPLFVSYFTGVCQDLFIAFQQLFCLLLIKSLFPAPFPALFWLFAIGSSVLQLHILLDAFLHMKTSIRMELSFFSFINDARYFWDSAKEKKIWQFIPGALLVLFFPFFAYLYFGKELTLASLKEESVMLSFLLVVIGGIATFLLPKKLVYTTDQIIFQYEIWYLKKLFRFFKRKSEQISVEYLVRAFKSKTEKTSYPSLEYPLLKYTHGFKGEKQFDLEIKEGECPHIIFLFLESFRSHDVGCLGGKRGVTPHFDRLAKEGILFSNFYANSVRTSRSVVSSLFGIPSDIDGSEVAAQARIPFIGIPQLLQEAGYQTSYLHNGPVQFENQDAFFDLHGYDKVLGRDDIGKHFSEMDSTSWGLPDECLMHYAAQFLQKRSKTPQFLTLFTITNHHPWNLPTHHNPPKLPSDISRTYRKYLNTFHYSDACLGLFIDLLKEAGLAKDTLLFILGDHGYPMGEHGNFVEQRYLYEENIQVPLLIYADGRVPSPKTVDQVASQLDLVPTVMDLLGLHGLNHSVGSSLVRSLPKRKVFFHNPYVFKNYGCREENYKFIYTRISQELELYNLKNDPLEKHNIANENPQLAQEFLYSVKNYKNLFHHLYGEKQIVPVGFEEMIENGVPLKS